MSEQAETIRRPLLSGNCASGHSIAEPDRPGHDRCHRQGGGQRANPQREFQPCPCACHYGGEVYECGGCGREIVEAPMWPFDEDGDLRYTHIDGDGKATGEDCTVSGNRKPEPEAEVEQDSALDEVLSEMENSLTRALAAMESAADEDEEDEDDDFIGLDPEPVAVEPEEDWDDLLSEFDLDDEDEA